MTTGLLNLDSRETWHPDFEALVYNQEVWSEVEARLNAGKIESSQFLNRFLEQITCREESLTDDLARTLRAKAREILVKKYTHVTAYHGCRPKDRRTYQESGILPSDTESLISEARSLFAGIGDLEKALKDIGPEYLSHNEGKVGLLFSAIRAKQDQNEYANGSELMRGLAYRLGREAKVRFTQTGKPMLIQCAIPVDWLDKHTTFPVSGSYADHVLEELIRRKRWPNDEFPGCSGGYFLTRAVPPENILEFIDMTEFSNEDRWVKE
jgi:hypothetical protein